MLYDKDIREPLFDYLEEKYGKIRILEEKRTGSARADAVMITPELIYGIEIKSDADSYVHLQKQVKNYNLYYDRNIIVAGSSHGNHVREHVPEWWGIITVEETPEREVDFYCLRKPSEGRPIAVGDLSMGRPTGPASPARRDTTSNPRVKPLRKISILWRPELNHILAKNNLPKYRRKSKRFVQEKLLERIEEEILWPQVYEELFGRDYTTIEQELEQFRHESERKRYAQIRKR